MLAVSISLRPICTSLLCTWRVFAHRAPHAAQPNHLRPIHPQRLDRRSASRSQPIDHCSVVAPGEMVSPLVLVRMKKGHFILRYRIERRCTIRLVSIAGRARETDIVEVGFASCLSWHYMLEFKYRDRQILWSLTIGAPIREPNANLLLKIRRDVGTHAREAPAWSCCNVYLARVLRTVS
jgi:hypothetical protein